MNWKLKTLLAFDRINPSLPHDDSVDINELRRHAARIAGIGTKLFQQVCPVASVRNLSADGVPVRLYDNSGKPGQPVILYFHGGGFVMYDLDTHDAISRRLCVMNKALVVSVDYRLAPEHTFPAAHEDAWTAIIWAVKNIAPLNGDPSRIIITGDSAGGNLAACMAFRARLENIHLAGQVLIYPWVDGRINSASVERNGEGYFLSKASMLWFQKKYTPNPEDHFNPLVSPLFEEDFSGLAPAFVITAEYDPLLDDGKSYAEKMSAAGVRVLYKEYKGLVHGFFNIPGIDPAGMQAYRDIRDFVQSVM